MAANRLARFSKKQKNNNNHGLDRSLETVRLSKSRPRKDQSERWDLPCHIIMPWRSVSKRSIIDNE